MVIALGVMVLALIALLGGAPVIVAPWLLFRGWDGYATPFFVVVRREEAPLVAHELCHLRQWWRYGIILFPFVYLYQIWLYGYYNAPLETEARECAKQANR